MACEQDLFLCDADFYNVEENVFHSRSSMNSQNFSIIHIIISSFTNFKTVINILKISYKY